jgi:hypothetical protein
MLRAVGWAVSLVVGLAAPAVANQSGHGAQGLAAAAQQGPATRGNATLVAERTTPVQVTGGWSGAHLFLRASMAGLQRELANQPTGLAMLAPERRETGGSPAQPWASGARPALGLSVSEQLSFAVGYQHVEGEDRWRPYGEAGPIDYDSHDFLLGVAWRF